MPIFIENGPEIPEELLKAHEDEKVVFFCGAGISFSAGLPLFKGLVDQIYASLLGYAQNDTQKKAYGTYQYDRVIHLLEADYIGKRKGVRKVLHGVLSNPKLDNENARIAHEALLLLARSKEDKAIRLVTTNFDRIFQKIIKEQEEEIKFFSAPLLPIPKKSRWNGIVYLHGLLPETSDEAALENLVLSSGDFGLAYLIEGWASRFVSELFKNYTVCFIGYSISDPILRYVMDALAADNQRGEQETKVYAFASYPDENSKKSTSEEWESKGVEPILYHAPVHNHNLLYKSLHVWADNYDNGLYGKQMIIQNNAHNCSAHTGSLDEHVNLVLWALQDNKAADFFAKMNPAPPLDWLEILSNDTKNGHTSITVLVNKQYVTNVDDRMRHFGSWLTRHLDDPKLILWIAKYGGQLCQDFYWQIEKRLQELDDLQLNNKSDELAIVREQSPKAIPRPLMRRLWNIVLAGRIKPNHSYLGAYALFREIKAHGLTHFLRLKLFELLCPCVILRESYSASFINQDGESTKIEHMRDLVDWELQLAANHSRSAYSSANIKHGELWRQALPELLLDFTILLRDAMELGYELKGGEVDTYTSLLTLWSIAPHDQNTNAPDWCFIIELARDAWLATAASNKKRALHVAETWWCMPYHIFKRLCFFAATQEGIIPHKQSLKWLLTEDGKWLWSIITEHEVILLLKYLAPRLNSGEQEKLEKIILAGLTQDKDNRDQDARVWLRLATLKNAGAQLSNIANNKLEQLNKKYPNWGEISEESHEFPAYSTGARWVGDPIVVERTQAELVSWLEQNPEELDDWGRSDDWRPRCKEDFLGTSSALLELFKKGIFVTKRWETALCFWGQQPNQVESETNIDVLAESLELILPVLQRSTDEFLKELSAPISYWLEKIAVKINKQNEKNFLDFCSRLIDILPEQPIQSTADCLNEAINLPIGEISRALVQCWFQSKPEINIKLDESFCVLFSKLCDIKQEKYQAARVILAMEITSLFKVDPEWTKQHLLPLLNWNPDNNEAYSIWQGFLYSPQLLYPLMTQIKGEFLKTSVHYQELGTVKKNYVSFLAFIILNHNQIFTEDEMKEAIKALPSQGISLLIEHCRETLEAAEDKIKYWEKKIVPFYNLLPKTKKLKLDLSRAYALLCITAGDAFANAYDLLKDWLGSTNNDQEEITRLFSDSDSDFCTKFPSESLHFLNAIVTNPLRWHKDSLNSCLEKIKQANPSLANDEKFNKLLNN